MSTEETYQSNSLKEAPQVENKRPNRFIRALANILGGSVLTRETVLRSLPYLLYLTALGLFYIANTYHAEKTIMKSDTLRKEIKEMRYEFVTTRSALMHWSKQSEVAKKLEPTGLKESRVPPKKISKKELKN